MKRHAALLALGVFGTSFVAVGADWRPPEEEARALIGRDFEPASENLTVIPELSCVNLTGAFVMIRGKEHQEWEGGMLTCQDRYVLVLAKFLGRPDGETPRYHVVDTLIMPPGLSLFLNEQHPEGPYLFEVDCKLDDHWDTSVYAIVRLGKARWMTWRNGVERAWTFDIQKQRIIEVSPKRVICYHDAEPD
jgi:hypothetical protein